MMNTWWFDGNLILILLGYGCLMILMAVHPRNRVCGLVHSRSCRVSRCKQSKYRYNWGKPLAAWGEPLSKKKENYLMDIFHERNQYFGGQRVKFTCCFQCIGPPKKIEIKSIVTILVAFYFFLRSGNQTWQWTMPHLYSR